MNPLTPPQLPAPGRRCISRALAVGAAVVLALAVAGCGGSGKKPSKGTRAAGGGRPPVTIGTKNFAEQLILGELYAQALRARGFRVTLKSNIGSSEIVHSALEAGTLDMYPEYTGTLLSAVAQQTRRLPSADDAYRRAKRYEEARGFTLLERTPFQDRDALAVKPAFARRERLSSIADLAQVSGSLPLGGPPEFRTRFEGFLGLQQAYRLLNLVFRPIPIGSQYDALDRGEIKVADVFTTDGRLQRSRYVVLADPKNLFGFQNVAPVLSRKVLAAEGAGFAPALNAVSSKLTTRAMRRMNAAVALQRQPAARVAGAFLRANGLR